MLVKGLFNSANVYTDNVEESALEQIKNLCNNKDFSDSKIRIMPDVHGGVGCVIGLTMSIGDKVCPNLVGVDIGCGMLAVKFTSKGSIDFKRLDDVIRKKVPFGFHIHSSYNSYGVKFPYPKFINSDAGMVDYLNRSIGTLGGGNHFIEVDKTEEEGVYWLVVHSGSRKLGVLVAQHYQKMAEGENKGLECIQGDCKEAYLNDMKIAQNYARLNRMMIVKEILVSMGWAKMDEFSTVHNYVDLEAQILRKGAVSAKYRERFLVPLNMRDGSLICIGEGNEEWNYSAPHGAGRILSRNQAKKILDLDEYKLSMEGIYSSCVSINTLDESAMAYKNSDEIINAVWPTASVVEHIKPVYNFKAED